MHSLAGWPPLVTPCGEGYCLALRVNQELALRQATLRFFALTLHSPQSTPAVQMYMNCFTKREEGGKTLNGITEKGKSKKLLPRDGFPERLGGK